MRRARDALAVRYLRLLQLGDVRRQLVLQTDRQPSLQTKEKIHLSVWTYAGARHGGGPAVQGVEGYEQPRHPVQPPVELAVEDHHQRHHVGKRRAERAHSICTNKVR